MSTPDPRDIARQFAERSEVTDEPQQRRSEPQNGLEIILAGCEDLFSECGDGGRSTPPGIQESYEIVRGYVGDGYAKEDVELFAKDRAPEYRTYEQYPKLMGLYLSALINTVGKPQDKFTLELPHGGTLKPDYLCAYLDGPVVVVRGHIGDCFGFGMLSGRAILFGAARDNVGMCMRGDYLHVQGTVRSGLGNAMEGGIIHVGGRARGYIGMNAQLGEIHISGDFRALANDARHYHGHSRTYPISEDVTITHNSRVIWP